MKPWVKIFLLSLVVQAVAFFVIISIARQQRVDFVVLTGDAGAYRALAENIFNHRVFSLSSASPFFPESFRSPGYPVFLTFLYAIFRNWFMVIFAQGLLGSFLPVLLYMLGKRIHERAAFSAAVVFVFEPMRLFLTNNLLGDVLFTTILMFSFLVFLGSESSGRRYFFSGILLGIAALMRPIAGNLPFIFIPFLWVFVPSVNYQRRLILVFTFLAGFLLVVFPWSLRNKVIFDSWQLSSVASSNLAHYNVPEFLKYKNPSFRSEALEELKKLDEGLDPLEAHSLKWVGAMNKFSMKYISNDPFGYVWFHLLKVVPFFVTDGLRDIARSLNLLDDLPPNLSSLIAKGDVAVIRDFVKEGGLAFFLFILGFIFWAAVSFLAFALIIAEFFKKRGADPFIIFLTLIIFYFALLTGPVSNARYRFPVSGILIFFATMFLFRKFFDTQKTAARQV